MSGKQAKRQRAGERQAELDEARSVVSRFIRGAVDKLRQEYARRLKIIRRNDPEGTAELAEVLTPCRTCAFRRTADYTDGVDGFLQTSTSLVAAMAKGRPFMCHNPKESSDDSQYTPRDFPCIGWLTLQSPIPGPFDVRELLGDDVVDLCVQGNDVLNPERRSVNNAAVSA